MIPLLIISLKGVVELRGRQNCRGVVVLLRSSIPAVAGSSRLW